MLWQKDLECLIEYKENARFDVACMQATENLSCTLYKLNICQFKFPSDINISSTKILRWKFLVSRKKFNSFKEIADRHIPHTLKY